MEFAIVNFLEHQEVATVPAVWISEDNCRSWWPPYKKSDKISKAVQKQKEVDPKTWLEHDIRVIKYYGKICFKKRFYYSNK